MPKLPVYNNCTPLNLTAENLLSARKTIRHIIDNLSFLDIRLQQTPNFTNVHTHIGLLENDFAEITKLLRYDTVLAEEHEQRNQELCEAHRRIRELEEQLGQDVSADGVSAKLREFDNIIRCVYGAMGFLNVRLEQHTPYGISYTFLPQVEYGADDGYSGNKKLAAQLQTFLPLIAADHSEFDLKRDDYHAELLDTDKNKQLIQTLFTRIFPNIIFRSFQSRKNDCGSFSLGFTVHLSYSDIEKSPKRIVEGVGIQT